MAKLANDHSQKRVLLLEAIADHADENRSLTRQHEPLAEQFVVHLDERRDFGDRPHHPPTFRR
jgi:hypothetical protein